LKGKIVLGLVKCSLNGEGVVDGAGEGRKCGDDEKIELGVFGEGGIAFGEEGDLEEVLGAYGPVVKAGGVDDSEDVGVGGGGVGGEELGIRVYVGDDVGVVIVDLASRVEDDDVVGTGGCVELVSLGDVLGSLGKSKIVDGVGSSDEGIDDICHIILSYSILCDNQEPSLDNFQLKSGNSYREIENYI
jgi:hypothetical protein